jgi:hypothetical protein
MLYYFFNLCGRWGEWLKPCLYQFTSGNDPITVVLEAGCATGQVWSYPENLASTLIRFPDRPACSESLCRLWYPGPRNGLYLEEIRRNSVDTVTQLRVGVSGSLLWTPSRVMKWRGGGDLEGVDNPLETQGLCSMEIFCFFRYTVSTNFMSFLNITVLKLRKPH